MDKLITQTYLEEICDQVIAHENNILHLTANENILSPLCQKFLSLPISNRYILNHHNQNTKNTYSNKDGFYYANITPTLPLFDNADMAAKKLFSAEHLDFRPLSGLHAVTLIILATTQPGDLIWCLPPQICGHFSTINLIQSLGRKHAIIPWDEEKKNFDLSLVETIKNRPNSILLDYADPIYPLQLNELRSIIGNKAILIYDASHVLGLIAGNLFQNPLLEGADILIASTHKTFPGPQKGIIAFKKLEYGQLVAKKIGSGFISSQHTHHTLALCISLIEMLQHAESYAKTITYNAKALAENLESQGADLLISPENMCAHTVYCRFPKVDNITACKKLLNASISVNTRTIYNFPCLRFGVQEVTRRGMAAQEMAKIAHEIGSIVNDNSNTSGAWLTQLLLKFNECQFTFKSE